MIDRPHVDEKCNFNLHVGLIFVITTTFSITAKSGNFNKTYIIDCNFCLDLVDYTTTRLLNKQAGWQRV